MCHQGVPAGTHGPDGSWRIAANPALYDWERPDEGGRNSCSEKGFCSLWEEYNSFRKVVRNPGQEVGQMSVMMLLLSIGGVMSVILTGLIIYRSILGSHEGDQLFLSQGEAALEREQVEVLRKINRLDPVIRWLAIVTGALLFFVGAWWSYRGLYDPAVY